MEIQKKLKDIKEKYSDKSYMLRVIADKYEKGERPIIVNKEQFTQYFRWMKILSSQPEPTGLAFMDTHVVKK